MSKRIDGTRLEQTELHRAFKTRLHQCEAVLLIYLAPRLGPQDGWSVHEDDLPDGRVDGCAEKSIDSEAYAFQRIGCPVRCYDNGFDELPLDVLEDGSEQIPLRPEMVIQRALRDTGAFDDIVDGRGRVALSREQLPGHGQQLPPCRLRSFCLTSRHWP